MISIITVNYKSEKYILDCIASIKACTNESSHEIIIVDNNEEKNNTFEKDLKRFKNVTYIKNIINSGYTGGNNLGATHAKGEYLFFLNPDTKIVTNVLEVLQKFIDDNEHSGAVAPLLLDENKHTYPLQGTKILGIIDAFFAYSILNKWFPNNSISRRFWNIGWDKNQVKEVDVVPGTAFMIRKSIFDSIGKFDEQFFLFFDEYDFCRRLKKKGYKNFIIPAAKIIHFWGKSTSHRTDTKGIFLKSRKQYFQKYYGSILAILMEGFLRISTETLIILGIFGLAAFMRLYEINKLMIFIGDFAWFYLSAKDLVISHHIPLVGIASSHTWIHQGAYWTYLLGVALWFGNFHPVAGGYLAAIFGIFTTISVYFISKKMFGTKVAFFSTVFYATSPLAIITTRMPYHTAPIPLFIGCFIYAVYRWIKGTPYYFPIALLLLSVLYNFEIATSVFTAPIVLYVLYGILRKKQYAKKIFSRNIIIFSLLAIFVPLIPMLIYDTTHGFAQTVKYVIWLGYRILVLFGYPLLHPESQTGSFSEFLSFLGTNIREYYYFPNFYIAISLCIASFISLFKKYQEKTYLLLIVCLFLPLIALVINKTPSSAYLPMLFVQLAMSFGILMNELSKQSKLNNIAISFFVIIISFVNVFTLIQNNFFIGKNALYGESYTERLSVSKAIVTSVTCSEYSIVAAPENAKFESFIMPYEYLTWWLGKPPKKNAAIKIEVKENNHTISIKKL